MIKRYSDDYEALRTNLNHDINLKYKNKNNKWDWEIYADNFKMATGEESLTNGIIHKLLTGSNEMKNNPTYYRYGNPTYDLIKENKTQLTKIQVEEYCRKQLEDIRRVKKINYINVEETDIDPFSYLVNFEVVSENNKKIEDGVFI